MFLSARESPNAPQIVKNLFHFHLKCWIIIQNKLNNGLDYSGLDIIFCQFGSQICDTLDQGVSTGFKKITAFYLLKVTGQWFYTYSSKKYVGSHQGRIWRFGPVNSNTATQVHREGGGQGGQMSPGPGSLGARNKVKNKKRTSLLHRTIWMTSFNKKPQLSNSCYVRTL
jgi:hypothetical protein